VFFTATVAGATVTGVIPEVLYVGYTAPAAFGFNSYRMPWEANTTVFDSFGAETQTFVATGSVVIDGVVAVDSESIEIDIESRRFKVTSMGLAGDPHAPPPSPPSPPPSPPSLPAPPVNMQYCNNDKTTGNDCAVGMICGKQDGDGDGRALGRNLLSSPATTPTFTTVATIGQYKYDDVAAVGTKLVFCPYKSQWVGVLDTSVTPNAFSTVVMTGDAFVSGGQGNNYKGAATVGTQVVFAPWTQNTVGVYDSADNSFKTVATTGIHDTVYYGGNYKYAGAAAVGTKVYFAPACQMNVGVYDTATGVFSTIATKGTDKAGYGRPHSRAGRWKYDGAAAVGTNVYFAPSEENNIGVLNTITRVFRTISIRNVYGYKKYGENGKFQGAAALNSYVVFAPYNSRYVGVLDTVTDRFSISGLSGAAWSGSTRYHGAAVVGNKVYFAPYSQINVGVFDPGEKKFSTIAVAKSSSGYYGYHGAAAIGNSVYFSPMYSSTDVGVLTLPPPSPPPPAPPPPPIGQPTFTTIAVSRKYLYVAAAAVGTTVVFCPYQAKWVGQLDTSVTPNAFTTVATTGDALVSSGYGDLYKGAATVGTQVVFAPYKQNTVGVYDSADNSFKTVATTGIRGNYKYSGAAAVGIKVYFAPCMQMNVGVYDTATGVFSTIATKGTDLNRGSRNGQWKYDGAAAVGINVYFAPQEENNIGVLNTVSRVFSTIALTGAAARGGYSKYQGAAALGKHVVFAPHNQHNVGVLDTSSGIFRTVSVSAGLKGYWVGRCRFSVSKPVLKAPVASALEAII